MERPTAIVLAEDSPVQAAMLRRLLSEQGYAVQVCRSGDQAWEHLQHTQEVPDLLISDIEMPGIDGYELCRRVKADPRLWNLPVLLLTGLTDPTSVIEGLQAGADNYVTKPFDNQLLLQRVQAILASPELYARAEPDTPLEVSLGGERYRISSSRGQVLNLLLSTFEGAVWQNRQLRQSNDELSIAHRDLADKNGQLEESLDIRNRFLGMVTHDMRNPLAVILGYSRILADERFGELNPKQKKVSEAIYKSTTLLLNLVNDLLEVSEIEAGKLRLEKQLTDLTALVQQSLELNGFLAESKSIRIVTELDPMVTVEVDPHKVEQVVNNLVSNAVKFSQANSEVRVQLHALDDRRVRLSVVDQGPGIPLAEQAQLFQFYQSTSVRSTAGEKSTGLGLAIVKRIVDGHGGAIRVESEPGKGSTFHVELPIHSLEVAGVARS